VDLKLKQEILEIQIPETPDPNKLIRYRNPNSVASRWGASGQDIVQFQFVHVTPDPGLPRFIGTDEGVLRFFEMFGGVLVLRRVATAHVTTTETQAQVNPGVPGLNAVFTDVLVGFSDFDLVQVGAFVRHGFLQESSS
jgi:hypothetical protein